MTGQAMSSGGDWYRLLKTQHHASVEATATPVKRTCCGRLVAVIEAHAQQSEQD